MKYKRKHSEKSSLILMIRVQGVLSIDNKTYFCVASLCMAKAIAIYLKVGYSPYVNKAFVYISVFKILNLSSTV
jgi:hypothetical protein